MILSQSKKQTQFKPCPERSRMGQSCPPQADSNGASTHGQQELQKIFDLVAGGR